MSQNNFSSVCQEFCPQGGSASVHAGIQPPGTPPPADTSPRQTTPLGRHPLQADTLQADTLLGRHPAGRHPPGQTSRGRHPPGQTPPAHWMLGYTWLLLQMVCILLECIFVFLCQLRNSITGWERLIRSHSLARFCFELSGNLN